MNILVCCLKQQIALPTVGINAGRLPENTGTNIISILEKFELMHNGILNNAAVVLFAKPDIYGYTQCLLRLARFRGTDKMEFIDSQRIKGNIFLLFDAAMAFIFKHLSKRNNGKT